MKLRKKKKLEEDDVIRRFEQLFPGRSPGSIQVHWSTKLNKRRPLLVKNSQGMPFVCSS